MHQGSRYTRHNSNMDQQSFNNYLANVQANAANSVQQPQAAPQQPAQQPQQQGGGGNFLTHLLPTAGSIGGGMGGAALGTAILPGIGTIAGGILGAALGGGASKAAENEAEGKGIGNGVESSAIEGGVGQALGGVAGKVLGKGAELLAGRAGGITKAAEDAAQIANVDKAAQSAAEGLKNAYADVPKGLRQQYDAAGQTEFVKGLGLDPTNPQNLIDTGQQANDILDSNLNGVLANSGTRDLSDYNNIVRDSLGKNGFDLGSIDKVALSKGRLGPANTPATQLLQQLEQHGMGVAKSTADPIEVRQLVSRLQSLAADAKPTVTASTGAIDPVQKATYNTINDVVGQLKDKLYNTDEVKQGISELKPNIAAEDVGGNQALADHLNGVIGKATQGQDMLDELSRFTNMNKLGNVATQAQRDVASPATLARAKADLNGNGIPDAVEQPSVVDTGHKILSGGGGPVGIAGRLVMHGKDNPAILNTLSRMGALTAKVAPTATMIAATAPNLGASPVGVPQQGGTMGAAMQPAQQSPLNQLYQTLLDNYNASGGITPNDANIAGTLAQLEPQVQRNSLVSGELGALPGAFANAGGAQGEGGILSRIAGLVPGTAQHTFQQQSAGAAQALAAQLGISSQAAAGLLPQLMQNQGTAGMNQGVLSQLTGQLAY